MTETFDDRGGFTPNREMVEAGMTWCAEQRRWMTHESLGATVTKAPEGWRDLFGAPAKPRGLTVVSLAYDWKVWN
jgi:hypothetical protein